MRFLNVAKKKVRFDVNPLLSGPSLASRTSGGSPYRELMLSEIDVDPDQPRRVFDTDALNDLAASIREHGILSPILVRFREGGTYQLVAGERRYRASKIAGLASVPAMVLTEEEEEGRTLAKQLVENLQREDLTPMERALAIGQLKEAQGWSIREIAKRLGVSKGVVQRALDILSLPDDLQAALIAGASESKVLLLGAVEERSLRKEFLTRLADMTREQLVREIKSLKGVKEVYHGGTAPTASRKQESSPEDQRLVSEMQRNLGTKVSIVRKKSNQKQGKLLLEFYSAEELDGIYQRLMG